MKNLLDNLNSLSSRCEDISKQLRFEGAVCRAELNHRLSLNLSPEEEIQHYNEWMKKYGLYHLLVH